MRIICLVLALWFGNVVFAQQLPQSIDTKYASDKTSKLLLSGIGKALYDYEVAATSKLNKGIFEWRFILAEQNLRSQVNKEIAEKLTTFIFTYDIEKSRYDGKILRAKEGTKPNQVLATIYQQLRQNAYLYGKNLDSVQLDEGHFYVLYF